MRQHGEEEDDQETPAGKGTGGGDPTCRAVCKHSSNRARDSSRTNSSRATFPSRYSQNPAQTPAIPLDVVMKLIQALSPGLNLEATLRSLATVNQITPIPQPPPQEQNPSLAEISSKQTTKPDEPKASESKTSESTSQTSEKTEKTPTHTTPTPTTETTKPTDSITETISQTGPIQVLGDVAELGDNPDPKAVEGEGRVEELVQATMRAGEVGAVGAKVEKEVDEEDEMTRAEPEEIMGERMVESEIVVDGETLKAKKGRQEAEEEKEKTEELEEGRGSDVKREVSVETVRLGSEDGSKVSRDKGMEDLSKLEEKQDDEMEDDCKVVTETEAIRTGNNNEGEVGTRETRRRRRFS